MNCFANKNQAKCSGFKEVTIKTREVKWKKKLKKKQKQFNEMKNPCDITRQSCSN